jgi:4-phospho-D-threonate 3-dehydrogenase / 4-phospho-D-erythronate 3-dehydrogenase
MTQRKPVLAVTMGDPAGTGAEILARVLGDGAVNDLAHLICIGDAQVMRRAFAIDGLSNTVHPIHAVGEAAFQPGVLDVLDLANVDLAALTPGQIQALAGQAAYEYIDRSITLALNDEVDGVVTSAINKESLHLAGHLYEGHTEIFAEKTGTASVTMMLAAGEFRVTHVSTHCSLREAIERCRTARILDVIRLTDASLKRMGIVRPRLAVAGLNPHSGEQGLFGTEEMTEIQPAIDQALAEGIAVSERPEPPDTVFVRMKNNHAFDAVIAQYHDQGHIAAKIVDFFGGVNITLGLPIIRTSVDHGTAFDLAGTGKASPASLISAIQYACRLAQPLNES